MSLKKTLSLIIFLFTGMVHAKGLKKPQALTDSYNKEQRQQNQPQQTQTQDTYKGYLDFIKTLDKRSVLKDDESDFTDTFKEIMLKILTSKNLLELERYALLEAAIVRNLTWTGTTNKDADNFWRLYNNMQQEAKDKIFETFEF